MEKQTIILQTGQPNSNPPPPRSTVLKIRWNKHICLLLTSILVLMIVIYGCGQQLRSSTKVSRADDETTKNEVRLSKFDDAQSTDLTDEYVGGKNVENVWQVTQNYDHDSQNVTYKPTAAATTSTPQTKDDFEKPNDKNGTNFGQNGPHGNFKNSTQKQTTPSSNMKIDQINSSRLKILLWPMPKSHFTRKQYWGAEELVTGSCPGKCDVSEDTRLADEVDAIVAHGNAEGNVDTILPTRKKLNQLRIFFRLEPPGSKRLPNEAGYNWTFTYRRDSDVPYLYGQFRMKKNVTLTATQALAMVSHSLDMNGELTEELEKKYLTGRTKLVAWTVSHCQTKGRREDFVTKLQTYLQVDIYGRCGPLKCPSSSIENLKGCHAHLGKVYKFYLAFENDLCHDYVTEKLFNPLKNGLLPIVYGGANYGLVAPPGSYIDALSFPSIKELADHIKFLDKNPEEYLKYFLWTKYYQFEYIPWWCRLCTKLWQHSILDQEGQTIIDPGYSKVYDNMTSWFNLKPENIRNYSDSGPACRPSPLFH